MKGVNLVRIQISATLSTCTARTPTCVYLEQPGTRGAETGTDTREVDVLQVRIGPVKYGMVTVQIAFTRLQQITN